MNKRYEVRRTGGGEVGEGLLADEWEIDSSGALIFWDRDDGLKDFVIAYAHGQWASFYGTDD